jgi:hypothetical protein
MSSTRKEVRLKNTSLRRTRVFQVPLHTGRITQRTKREATLKLTDVGRPLAGALGEWPLVQVPRMASSDDETPPYCVIQHGPSDEIQTDLYYVPLDEAERLITGPQRAILPRIVLPAETVKDLTGRYQSILQNRGWDLVAVDAEFGDCLAPFVELVELQMEQARKDTKLVARESRGAAA